MLGQKPGPESIVPSDPPPPIPVTSATTPPVYTVDTAPPPPPSGGSAAPTELSQARSAADAKDFAKVKTILEKKARGGKASQEEAQLCLDACAQTRDKKCVAAIKTKYPSLTPSGT
jgi:hypothetical protein